MFFCNNLLLVHYIETLTIEGIMRDYTNYDMQTGVEISQKFWGPFGQLILKNWGPSIFCRARFGFSIIFYTSGIDMSQNFQGPFGPLVLTFCGPSPNFEGNWSEDPPYFNPCMQIIVVLFRILCVRTNFCWHIIIYPTLTNNLVSDNCSKINIKKKSINHQNNHQKNIYLDLF